MASRPRRSPARPGKKLLAFDRARGVRFVAGADEAGRGALAGPLVAAAVTLDLDRLTGPDAAAFGKLNDTKQLTPAVREVLYDQVLARASAVTVRVIPAGRIDADGLHVSNLRGLREAILALPITPDHSYVDGFDIGDTPFACERLIRGDSTSAAVAAAAIVAKVTRDRLMERLDDATRGRWSFRDHMGYATPRHAEAIQSAGISRHHRRSYAAQAYDGAVDASHAAESWPAIGVTIAR